MQKKKIISMLLVLTILIGSFSGVQLAAAASPEGDFIFDSSTGTITGYMGEGGAVEIPSTIDGVPVTVIGERAFQYIHTITSITVPEGVTTIGRFAFANCNALTYAELPDSITSMGDYVFSYNSKLVTVKLPSGLTAIPNSTFQQTTLREISIPDTVESIGDLAFYSNELRNLKLPSGLVTIGRNAFGWSSKLNRVIIPAGVTSIGDGAFLQQQELHRLKTVVFMGATAPTLGTTSPTVTRGIVNTSPDLKVYYPQGATGYDGGSWSAYNPEAFNPDTTYTVSYAANGGSGSTEGVAGVKTGEYVTVSANGFSKSEGVFTGWSTSESGSFWGERYLPGDKLPVAVGDVTLYAQWKYPLTIAPSVNGEIIMGMSSPGDAGYAKPGDLIDFMVFADIGYRLKEGGLKYTDSTGEHELSSWNFTMPASAVTISAEFEEGDYSFDKTTGTITGYNGRGGNVIIPSRIDGTEVKYIGWGAFCGEQEMLTDPDTISGVVIPEGVIGIEYSAFAGCSKMKGVVLPSTLEHIGYRAFADCYELTGVKIPDGLTSISDEAFSGCEKLSLARFEGNAPTSCGTDIFENTAEDFKILYPNGSQNFDTANLNEYTRITPESIDGAAAVASDLASLNIVYAFSDNKDSIVNNLFLPVISVSGSSISWSSSNPTVISNNGLVTIPDASSNDAHVRLTATASFDGLSNTKVFDVTVPSLATKCTVTFNKNGGSTEANPIAISAVSGGAIGTLPIAPTRTGYTFTGWNTEANGGGTSFTAATAVNANITVYAQWRLISSGYSSSEGATFIGNKEIPTPSYPNIIVTMDSTSSSASVTGTIVAEAKINMNEKASATVSKLHMENTINKVLEESAKQDGIATRVEIKVNAPTNVNLVETSLPKEAMAVMDESKAESLMLTTPVATITFDKKASRTIFTETLDEVKITASKVDITGLSKKAKALVGDRPVYNFSVTSGDKTISEFGGNVTVSVPYTPKADEDINAIVLYYIDVKGNPKIVKNCVYNKNTGRITFETNHFSKFAVGYNKVSFKDVAKNTRSNPAISFVAARDIINGTGKGNFSPKAKLTRGQFLVMAMKAYDMEAASDLSNNFIDAGNTYYTGYLATAKKLGITKGIGKNKFAPNREITRAEMCTLLYNILEKVEKLPIETIDNKLTDFSDAGEIKGESKDAMESLVRAGIVKGSGGKIFPKKKVTRVEMAQVFYNLFTK